MNEFDKMCEQIGRELSEIAGEESANAGFITHDGINYHVFAGGNGGRIIRGLSFVMADFIESTDGGFDEVFEDLIASTRELLEYRKRTRIIN